MTKDELEAILVTAATAELAVRYMLRGNSRATVIAIARTRTLSDALRDGKAR